MLIRAIEEIRHLRTFATGRCSCTSSAISSARARRLNEGSALAQAWTRLESRPILRALTGPAGDSEQGTWDRRSRIVVPFDGHVIGEGFNSQTVTRVGDGPGRGEGRRRSCRLRTVRLLQVPDADLSGELGKVAQHGRRARGGHGLFSGGAKFSFAEENAVNFTSTYILASCVVRNALQFGSGFKPNEAADRLVKAVDVPTFQNAFGDRFTQALHTGLRSCMRSSA